MIKRLTVALAALFVLATSAFGAGTIPYSLSQQFDQFGNVLAGCKMYVIQAGTTSTPQNAYQDSALTLVLPNPIICDSAGRLPQFFLADGSIKIRLTNSAGVTQVTADGILVVGASSGGGGGSPVDATTILATGDMKARYGTGVLTGFVRANGRTIGSATSGASERANADAQSLFEYLWGADANLIVSTGRGVSANADWVANKTIAVPDWRGRALAFLDDMGNSAAGRLTSTYFGTAATVLGAAGGGEATTLVTANLPPYTPAGTIGSLTTATSDFLRSVGGANASVQTGAGAFGSNNSISLGAVNSTGTFTGTAAPGQISTPVRTVQPTLLTTFYLKL